MSMTRKDYELIAKNLKELRDVSLEVNYYDHADVIQDVAETLAGEFAAANPAFKADKFLKACGID